MIISDDASTDETLDIINTFSKASPFQVKIIQNNKRLGITKNFGNAITACSGDIIFLSDQDDVWHPEKIATLSDILEKNPETGLVHCNASVVDGHLISTGNTLWESFWFNTSEQNKVKIGKAFDVYLRHSVAAGMSVAFRADLFWAVLPIPDIYSIHDVWTALVIAAISKIQIVDKVLVKYRVHGVNQTVGIHKLSLKEQFTIARKQAQDDTFQNLVALHENLTSRIDLLGRNKLLKVSAPVRDKAAARLNHARMRRDLFRDRIKRMTQMVPEIINGNYFRFSYGIKSIVQDLILR